MERGFRFMLYLTVIHWRGENIRPVYFSSLFECSCAFCKMCEFGLSHIFFSFFYSLLALLRGTRVNKATIACTMGTIVRQTPAVVLIRLACLTRASTHLSNNLCPFRTNASLPTVCFAYAPE